MKIFDNILKTIGNTPIVRLHKIRGDISPQILVKLESFNPMGSVKDRIGIAMIEAAESAGLLNKNTRIIEPTSGNTGVGLAMVCATKGYPLSITMPNNVTPDHIRVLRLFGVEVHLTDSLLGMQGAINKAIELKEKYQDVFIPQQFENRANKQIHKDTTAQEILHDTEGKLAAFIAGIGTGGTISGIGEVLKKEIGKSLMIVGVEPEESAVLSGDKPGPHKIFGIGAGFIPKLLNLNIIDRIIKVSFGDALKTQKRLAQLEGIFAGISSGAALWATLKVAPEFSKEDTLLCLLPDTGLNYVCEEFFGDLACC